jgi:hypothetical protein
VKVSRSHAGHDHKSRDQDTTRHAGHVRHENCARATKTWPLTPWSAISSAFIRGRPWPVVIIRVSEVRWQAAVRGRCCACLLHCSRLAMRRLPCQCLSRRIRPTSGRCRCRAPCTPDPKTSCALVAATALVRTPAPVPARPASAGGGGGTVSAGTIPGSMWPTPLDSPTLRYSGSGSRELLL